MLIITAIHSLGLHHTEAACLCGSSCRNYQPNISKRALQGQAPCSISLLIPAHLSFPSATYPLLPPSPPTPSLQNFTQGLTFSSRTTIHFQSRRVVGWMAIDNSILGMKLENPFGIDSSPALHARARVPILLSPLLPTTCSALVCWLQLIPLPLYGDMGKMDAPNCLKCHTFPDTFSLCLLPFMATLLSNKQTLKTSRFILSIAPSWMFGSNLKMIYANAISLCVIQRSQLMSELLQLNYKLTRVDIIVRLMCFSGTCLIAGRLRWGQCELPHFYKW